jgi:hypothetical protein
VYEHVLRTQQVDLRSGPATIINWTRLSLRLRNSRVQEVHLDVDLRFGLQQRTSFRVQSFLLAPADRVLVGAATPARAAPAAVRGRILALTRTSPPAATGLSHWSSRRWPRNNA